MCPKRGVPWQHLSRNTLRDPCRRGEGSGVSAKKSINPPITHYVPPKDYDSPLSLYFYVVMFPFSVCSGYSNRPQAKIIFTQFLFFSFHTSAETVRP